MTIDPNEAVAAIRAIEDYSLQYETYPRYYAVWGNPNSRVVRVSRAKTIIAAVREWCRQNDTPWPEVVAATKE